MSVNIKPFRLINQSELSHLQQRFTALLQLWNAQYALHPLTCELENPSAWPDKATVITENGQAIARLLDSDLSIIKYCLFEDVAESFNSISETLLKTLLSALLDTGLLQFQPETPFTNHSDWHYAGSPSLALTLHGEHSSITLNIHPQWVLNMLPAYEKTTTTLGTISNAIAEQLLPLQVALTPMTLCLTDIMNLQIGDVMKTDHPISTPALLKQQEQTISVVNLGVTHHTKSIQITRPT